MSSKLKYVAQSENSECGLACVCMIAQFFGRDIGMSGLRKLYSVSSRGMTLRDIGRASEKVGLVSTGYNIPFEKISEVPCPAILMWGKSHFVVLDRVIGNKIKIIDPAIGPRTVSETEARKYLSNVVLVFKEDQAFKDVLEEPAGWIDLFGRLNMPWSSLGAILLISVVLESLALISPLYMQVITDRVIQWNVPKIIGYVATFFAIVYALLLLSSFTKSLLSERISLLLGRRLGIDVADHLTKLPYKFYLNRGPADIQSRFHSVTEIRIAITHKLTAAVIDSGVIIISVIAMFLFSPLLAGISIAFILIIALLRQFLAIKERTLLHKDVIAMTSETGIMLQNIRSVQAMKAQALEGARLKLWQQAYLKSTRAGFDVNYYRVILGHLEQFFLSLENLTIVSLGAILILKGDLTLGMLLAFFIYRLYVRNRGLQIVEAIIYFRVARVHLDRVYEILDTPQDKGYRVHSDTTNKSNERMLVGEIEFKDVWYRYGDNDPYVLEGVNFKLNAGEAVGLIGESGVGKSTLIRLMLGLLEPTSGIIIIDGINLNEHNIIHIRSQIGIVLQDDEVFRGSVAGNIANFDRDMDQNRVIEAAKKVNLHDEILQMKMGYNTMVNEGATTFSSGQKQRLFLARALYREPKLLVLDEGTANLDPANDARIAKILLKEPITRVYVAHHSALLDDCDRILSIHGASLTEKTIT